MNNTNVQNYQVIDTIQYRLKAGCQWRELPINQFFMTTYKWNRLYYDFHKWSKDGSWNRVWQSVLTTHKHCLHASRIQIDSSQTLTKQDKYGVSYQGRKKCSTSNLLIIADNQGMPLACSEPISGHHNDALKLIETTNKLFFIYEP